MKQYMYFTCVCKEISFGKRKFSDLDKKRVMRKASK